MNSVVCVALLALAACTQAGVLHAAAPLATGYGYNHHIVHPSPVIRTVAVAQPVVRTVAVAQPVVRTVAVAQPVVRTVAVQPVVRTVAVQPVVAQPVVRTVAVAQPVAYGAHPIAYGGALAAPTIIG